MSKNKHDLIFTFLAQDGEVYVSLSEGYSDDRVQDLVIALSVAEKLILSMLEGTHEERHAHD